MAKRQARFLTGLFVIVGVLIGVVAVVWLGASKYFEKGTTYVTYFDESVQGLQVDSEVKYRGVGVGNVKSIGVAPDQKLVEVVIKIALEGDVEHSTVTQLRAAGITGIVFVELDRWKPDDQVFLPPRVMKTPYTIIPSKPSQTKQVLIGHRSAHGSDYPGGSQGDLRSGQTDLPGDGDLCGRTRDEEYREKPRFRDCQP